MSLWHLGAVGRAGGGTGTRWGAGRSDFSFCGSPGAGWRSSSVHVGDAPASTSPRPQEPQPRLLLGTLGFYADFQTLSAPAWLQVGVQGGLVGAAVIPEESPPEVHGQSYPTPGALEPVFRGEDHL